MLKNLDNYIKYIDKRVINQDIFPQILLGFSDTSANMRESTIRTMIPLTPYLDVNNQTSMIKGLASLQDDQLPAIRTNVLVCLNKIVSDLDANVRKQVSDGWEFHLACIPLYWSRNEGSVPEGANSEFKDYQEYPALL